MPTTSTSKIGSKNVNPSSRGSSPANNVAGGPGKSHSQQPYPGPASPGQPSSMKKALSKKSIKGGDVTGAAGSVR